MNTIFYWFKVITITAISLPLWAKSTLELSPTRPLTIEQVIDVAKNDTQVSIDSAGWKNLEQGHEVVLQAALNNVAVYGLTVGVGWNKDKPVFKQQDGKKVLSEELITLSKQFNLSSLRAHAAGMGEALPEHIVRAAMLIRLNTMLKGETGVQVAVAQQYLDFLNHHITPVVPAQGSVGEADITLASHIGLAMVGEWDVFYQGKRQPAKAVLETLNIKRLEPVGKDFLSILSTNSVMAAKSVFLTQEAQALYQKQVYLFGLMLEGYNGNVAPFSVASTQVRPFAYVQKAAEDIRNTLAGSYLWEISENRALQDPLSFRTMAYTLGSVLENIHALKNAVEIQINATDDNPLVLIQAPAVQEPQLKKYEIAHGEYGAIYPTANFNFLPVVTKVEYLNQSLAKLAEVMTQQLIRLENPDFTKLSRFLSAANNEGHAFGAIQKPFLETTVRIKQLAQPASFYSATLAGNIEDTVTMSGIALENSQKIIDGIYEIDAFQVLHATQALDLRKPSHISKQSERILNAYRQQVPFIEQDSVYTPLIEKGITFWKQYQ
ncbi:histidine ammonia-lyase [Glaesserella sp.]|uniref:HAL/PAL/TAL family ammonia-lyase n=1 Tax=Glaesserella sp. TaxID=2094731 RepID=UPI00359F964E